MMKSKIATSCVILAACFITPLPVQAADSPTTSKATTYIKDSAITAKVKAKLAADKMSSLGKIKVETDASGVVFLSGRVRTQDEADKAEALARGTEGVTSVTNDIVVSAK